MTRVTDLAYYPLKSAGGVPVPEAVVEHWSIRHDRRWMLLQDDGRMISAREAPTLLLLRAEHRTHDGALVVQHTAGAVDPLEVSVPDQGEHREGVVWGAAVRGREASPEASAWFEDYLGRTGLHLVWCDDPTFRPVDQRYAEPGDTVTFSDGFPLLLTSTPSLGRLQEWVDESTDRRGEPRVELTMDRFRPSVVVDGGEPLEEQGWDRVRIGEMTFRMAKHCGRCVMTTYDTTSLDRTKEPLRSLGEHNAIDGRLVFGVNLVPEGTGTLRVGDEVTPIQGS